MKKILFVATLAASLAVLSACNSQPEKMDEPAKSTATGSGNADYDAALVSAKAEIKKAKAAGGEWRDIGKMLKHADKEASAGNFGSATKLVNKAKTQAILGQEQAATQVNVGNPAYLN